MVKYILIGLILLFSIYNVSAVTTFGPSQPGWYQIEDVTDLMMSGELINESDLAVTQVYMLSIYSGDVSTINIVSNTYSAQINITEPSLITTNINITFTNFTGDTTIKDYTINHIGKSIIPIYILIGKPPLKWGLSQEGVIAKTYSPISVSDLFGTLTPSEQITDSVFDKLDFSDQIGFKFGWDVYYDGYIEPPQTFTLSSDGPIDVLFEVTTIQEAYERNDRGLGEFALNIIRTIPFVGDIAANSLELIYNLFRFFINILIVCVENWPILFVLIETFILLHCASMIFSADTALDAIVGFSYTFAKDNVGLIYFIWDLITKAFGLLFDIISSLRNLSPI